MLARCWSNHSWSSGAMICHVSAPAFQTACADCCERDQGRMWGLPSVVPAAKLKPMAAGQVLPALVKLDSPTTTLVMSTNLCL